MILNLTQHNATKDQQDAGIIDMPVEFQVALKGLLTFPTNTLVLIWSTVLFKFTSLFVICVVNTLVHHLSTLLMVS